ncbi:hypothetical protein PG988_007192 [Apiospora saccharicola]
MKVIEYFIRPTNGSKTDLIGCVPSMIIANFEDHRRMRHTFAPAFSDRVLKAQEPMFHKHVDIMLAKIRDLVMRGDPIDMNVMLNCAAYNIMGDLTFGRSRGLLENIEYSHWLKTIIRKLKRVAATLLAGVIYYLLPNPSTLNRVADEIHTSFTNTESFTFERLGGLRYLNACLQEALRVYPPLPIGVARVVPPGGSPPLNFRHPDAFVPERWLDGHPTYRDDNRECLQPFSVGSRNCIGQNMARHEMRLILAKLLSAFRLGALRGEQRLGGPEDVRSVGEETPDVPNKGS